MPGNVSLSYIFIFRNKGMGFTEASCNDQKQKNKKTHLA
jgi:hypothetical protein